MSLLFISHASVDVQLAEFLETEARACIPGVEVFRTTRVGQIRPGREWASVVQEHLRLASHFLILLTPTSIARPWVLFEAGAAWMARKPLVPVVAGGLAKQDAPEPFSTLQVLSLEDPGEAAVSFREFGGTLTDPAGFAARIRSLGASARERALAKKGWKQTEFEGRTYAWEGPLHELPDGPPFPAPDTLVNEFFKRRLPCMYRYPEQVQDAQLEGYMELFMLDPVGTKRRVMHRGGQVLLVRPK